MNKEIFLIKYNNTKIYNKNRVGLNGKEGKPYVNYDEILQFFRANRDVRIQYHSEYIKKANKDTTAETILRALFNEFVLRVEKTIGVDATTETLIKALFRELFDKFNRGEYESETKDKNKTLEIVKNIDKLLNSLFKGNKKDEVKESFNKPVSEGIFLGK